MSEDDAAEVQEHPDTVTTPLRDLTVEAHELYRTLRDSGFPKGVATQIVAQFVSDAIMYNKSDGFYQIDDDDEDGDEDDLEDEPHDHS